MMLANLDFVFSPVMSGNDQLAGSISKKGEKNITGEGNDTHIGEHTTCVNGDCNTTYGDYHYGGVKDYSGNSHASSDADGGLTDKLDALQTKLANMKKASDTDIKSPDSIDMKKPDFSTMKKPDLSKLSEDDIMGANAMAEASSYATSYATLIMLI